MAEASKEQLEAARLRKRAVQMRVDRMSYGDIADAMGVSVQTARKWIAIGTQEWLPQETIEELRSHEVAVLDRLERQAFMVLERLIKDVESRFGKVIVMDEEGMKEFPKYVPEEFIKIQAHILDIQKRRARLLGIDAPIKMLHGMAVRTDYDAEIELLVLAMAGGGKLMTGPEDVDTPKELEAGPHG